MGVMQSQYAYQSNWGKFESVPIAPSTVPVTQLPWITFLEITNSNTPELAGGFAITIATPDTMFNATTNEPQVCHYRVDYGGGGVGVQTIQRITSRPLTFNIAGSYVRVSALLQDTAPAIASPFKNLGIFATQPARPLKYTIGCEAQNRVSILAGAYIDVDITQRPSRGLYYSFVRQDTGAPSPGNIMLHSTRPAGLGVVTPQFEVNSLANCFSTPLRLPDNVTFFRAINNSGNDVYFYYFFDEEL